MTSLYLYEKKVYQNGGKNFWVHNTGPAGCLPQILAMNNHTEADLDAHGCIESFNNAAKIFNKLLLAMCKKLGSELKDATIVHVDIYSIKLSLIANTSAYGIYIEPKSWSPFFIKLFYNLCGRLWAK